MAERTKKLSKKQIVLIVIASFLLFIFLATTIFLLAIRRDGYTDEDKAKALVSLAGEVKYFEPEGETPYLIKCDIDGNPSDQPFKIISVTDLHLTINKRTDFTFAVFDRLIKNQNPDLVVICGDIVHYCTVEMGRYDVCRRLGEFFEERGLYWAFVLGNHDGEESLEARRDFVAAFSGFEHCLTRNDDGDVYGETNYVINIKDNQNNITQSLIFMDSGGNAVEEVNRRYGFEYKEGYDFIKPDQIEWYRQKISQVTAENNGKLTKSMLFIHIALTEYKDAYAYYKKHKEAKLYGSKVEIIGSSETNSGLFSVIKELKSTTAVICGHDHKNDFCIEYQGVKLLYSQSLSYAGYNSRDDIWLKMIYKLDKKRLCYFPDGCTTYFVFKNTDVTIVPQYCENIEGIFDGLDFSVK